MILKQRLPVVYSRESPQKARMRIRLDCRLPIPYATMLPRGHIISSRETLCGLPLEDVPRVFTWSVHLFIFAKRPLRQKDVRSWS